MTCQTTFERYEMKYLLTKREKDEILTAMEPYMKLDEYGRSTIRNIYYDTDTYRLIRRSLEKPAYKEKLRIRSYQQVAPEDPVFVELKKKYKSVVYKRRLILPESEAMASFQQGVPLPVHSQIADEIEYFRSYYESLKPTVFLAYEREPYYALDGGDFRITFDDHILFREHDISLRSEVYGMPLLEDDQVLMEIKTGGGMPIWMSHKLAKLKVYRSSFSKYGTAYQLMISKETNKTRKGIFDVC